MLRHFYIFCFLIFLASEGFCQQLWWAESNSRTVRYSNLNGANVNVFYTNPARYMNEAHIDSQNGYVFYGDGGDGIYRLSLRDTSEFEVFSGLAPVSFPTMSLNTSEQLIYYPIDEGSMYTYQYDGTTLNSWPLNSPTDISNDDFYSSVVHYGNEEVYISNITTNLIYRVGWDYTSWTALNTGSPLHKPRALALNEFTNKIYWVNEETPSTVRIMESNTDGSSTRIVFDAGSDIISSLAIYHPTSEIFYVKNISQIYKVNVDGTGNTILYTSGSFDIKGLSINTDILPPVFTALTPLDNAINVQASNASLVLTFNESVKVSPTATSVTGEKSIRIINTTTGTTLQTIDRGNSSVSISGNVVTITGIPTMDYNSNYYVLIGTKVFSDLSNNDWVGISLNTGWDFTTEADQSKFYSRQSGDWTDPNTWSHVSHTGPAAAEIPGCAGCNTTIGSGHTVALTADASALGSPTGPAGLVISSGATLNGNGHILTLGGDLSVAGSFSNAGEIHSSNCGSSIHNTSGNILIVDRLVVNDGCAGALTLYTDIVVLNGTLVVIGSINTNGFKICDASMTPPVNPLETNKKSNSITLTWQAGASDAFVVARAGSTNFEPSFGSLYNANAAFGSGATVGTGNYVVYKGTGTSVDITNLTPATDYEFDLYSYNTTVGGCYSKTSYQFFQVTTCPTLAAPTNPVDASYCLGSTTVLLKVDDPGTGKRIDWYGAPTGAVSPLGTIGGVNNETFIPTGAGTFYAEVVDVASGCASTTRTPVTLTANTLPTASDVTPAVCESTPGSASAIVNLESYDATVSNNATGTRVAWYTDSNVSTPVPSPTSMSTANGTKYYAKVYNTTTQCSTLASATFTVSPLPTATLSGPLTVCANAKNIQYQATSGTKTYTWVVPAGASIQRGSGTSSIVVDFGTTGGIISVLPSDGAGCDGKGDKLTVSVEALPTVFAVKGGGVYCTGGNGVVVGLVNSTAGTRYEIYTGGTASNLVTSNGGAFDFPPITQPGVYTVKATTGTLCTADMSGSATVTQGNTPTGIGTIKGITKFCKDKDATYSVTGISSAIDYQWTLPDGITRSSQVGNSITVVASGGSGGNISVVGNNECGNGGFASLDVQVSTPPTIAIVFSPGETIIDDSKAFSFTTTGSVESVAWNFGDAATSADESPTHSYASGGDYTVTLVTTDALGCESKDKKGLTVIAEPGLSDYSIKNAVTTNGDGKNDVLYIERIDKFPDNEVIILDRWGVEVIKLKGYNNDWDFKKNGDYLPPGNYVCIVKINESGKVVKRTVTVIKGK